MTREAQQLLDKVIELYIAHRSAHRLQPGQILLLDNLRAMHGRSPFEPRFDGTDRFMARGFVVRDRRGRLGVIASDLRTIRAEGSRSNVICAPCGARRLAPKVSARSPGAWHVATRATQNESAATSSVVGRATGHRSRSANFVA